MVTDGQGGADSDNLSPEDARQMMGVALIDLTPERESSAIDELANSQLLNRDAFIEYIEVSSPLLILKYSNSTSVNEKESRERVLAAFYQARQLL